MKISGIGNSNKDFFRKSVPRVSQNQMNTKLKKENKEKKPNYRADLFVRGTNFTKLPLDLRYIQAGFGRSSAANQLSLATDQPITVWTG